MKREGTPRLKSSGYDAVKIRDILSFPPSYWLLAMVLVSFYASVYPFISFSSDFLQMKWGYGEEDAGRLASLLSVTAMIFAPIMGYTLDKIGMRIHAVNIGNLLIIPACLIMAYTDIHPVFPIVAIGACYSLVPAAIWPSLSIIVEDKAFATAYGLSTSLANLALIPAYWLIGKLVDETNEISESLVIMAVFSFVGLIFGILWNIVDRRNGSPCNGSPNSLGSMHSVSALKTSKL